MRSIYFYSTILGFFVGIFVASNSSITTPASIAITIVGVVIVLFNLIHSKLKDKPLAHPLIIVAMFAIFACIGALRMVVMERGFINNPLIKLVGDEVKLVGTIQEDVNANDPSAVIKVYAVANDNGAKKIEPTRVLLRFPGVELLYGDTVVVSGRLGEPTNFEAKDGKAFDYVSYLKKSDITVTLGEPKIIFKEVGDITIPSLLYSIKRWFVNNVLRVVPEPESALATGVSISGKGGLPKDVKEDFINAGLIHIVVLSGYNIAIVIRLILYMFGFVGRKWSAIIALAGVSAFVVISGGSAPVVRAAIMASITLIGALSYTSVLQNRALFGAAFLMVMWNPMLLTTDASFALSFLATFAIINVVPMISPYFKFVTSKWYLKETLSETLATQVFVLPYLLYQIGKFSLIAPLSNVIILPLIPIIMMLCFIVGIVGGLGYLAVLALPIGGLLYLVSHLVIRVSHLFATLPFAAFDLTIPLSAMVFIYIAYFMIGIVGKKKIPQAAHAASGIDR